MILRVEYGFCKSNNRHFPSRSLKLQYAWQAVQIKKSLCLKKAPAVASTFRLIGLLGLRSNADVEFELSPALESKAARKDRMRLNVMSVVISCNLIFVNNNNRTRPEVAE